MNTKPGEGISFPIWSKAECSECGEEFQITRTIEKTVFGPIICGECKEYDKAYNEGKKAEVGIDREKLYKELGAMKERICSIMEDLKK